MRHVVLLLACLALSGAAPNAARAASFDCAKATTEVEKRICADPELSSADEKLAETYKAALAASLRPGLLRDQQQGWLKERDVQADNLRALYRSRIEALAETVAKWQAARQPIELERARTHCVASPDAESDEDCKVDEFGTVAGAPDLRYQLQSYSAGRMRAEGGTSVLEADGDRLTPIALVAAGAAHFAPPRLVSSPAGRLLVLPGHQEGTGNFNADAVFQYGSEPLQEVDVNGWLNDLAKQLPEGWLAMQGIYPDYGELTARTPLWHDGEANCCPTAGRADITFRLADHRLAIESVRITRGKKAAEDGR